MTFWYEILYKGRRLTSGADAEKTGKREVALCCLKLSTTDVEQTSAFREVLAPMLEDALGIQVGDTIEVRISALYQEADPRPPTPRQQGTVTEGRRGLHCSFCWKGEHQVKTLLAAPSASICNDCVQLCRDILQESSQPSDTASP
jgi:ClpX C4-type zinc finger